MDKANLVKSIQEEISRLKAVEELLSDEPKRKVVRDRTGRPISYTMNAAARKRISEAQKARWAKVKDAVEVKVQAGIKRARAKNSKASTTTKPEDTSTSGSSRRRQKHK